MKNGTIIMSWSRPLPGREMACNQLFSNTLEYFGGQLNKGRIDSFEPILLSSNGGPIDGFFLIKGDSDGIAKMTGSDEWLELVTKANVMLEGFAVVPAYSGEDVSKVMKVWRKVIDDL